MFWRWYSYPELLFILLVNILPLPVAFFWARTANGFLVKLLISMVGGFVIWLVIVLLVVWPRFRNVR